MTTHAIAYPARSVGQRIVAFLAAAGAVMADSTHGARCAREAERLFGLSDAELAKRGLTRDGIVAHAFRRYMTV